MSYLNSAWYVVRTQEMITVFIRVSLHSAKAPGVEFAQEISKAGCSIKGTWKRAWLIVFLLAKEETISFR